MAERSKALVSGTSLFGGVGSNPTSVTRFFFIIRGFFFFTSSCPFVGASSVSRLAQLVERKTLNLVVEGSSPSVGTVFS